MSASSKPNFPNPSPQGANEQVEDEAQALRERLTRDAALSETDKGDSASNKSREGKKERTPAEELVLLTKNVSLFRTANDEAWVQIHVVNNQRQIHWENWPLRSDQFKNWLFKRFYTKFTRPCPEPAWREALATLQARAQSRGRVYVDLCDDDWQVIEIDTKGWQVRISPIHFFRKPGALALPLPKRGGSIQDLAQFLNTTGDGFTLAIAWLVAAFRPAGPYPILSLVGEPGSAKTTTARVLASLIDPRRPTLRTPPRDVRDLAIAAKNAWTVGFDNMRWVEGWLSDALCRLATGSGFSTRQLYTDDSEALFSGERPVLLNGVTDLTPRHDLADRMLAVPLEPIPPSKRRTEAEFWHAFEEVRPRIFGALLDAVSVALRNLPKITLPELPRMADFYTWATAAEPGLGWPAGTFAGAYSRAMANTMADAVERDTVASAVVRLMREQAKWTGTAAGLLEALEAVAPAKAVREKHWPKAPNVLTNRLKSASAFLRGVGIDVQFRRAGDAQGTRMIALIRRAGESPAEVMSVSGRSDSVPVAPTIRAGSDGQRRIVRGSSGPSSEAIQSLKSLDDPGLFEPMLLNPNADAFCGGEGC
jgi:hypothetical protein